ncbi:type I-E CRISPR-associated protein Cse1/CasA [Pseudodesulfovibrio tunisiensis]|uniref:type I-E CRISPR-associated protein Cse1/CasA n=1 Tax=Pseudodesulfovibrio tunisiensis TaxID=463192 RepID=UPI001FB435BB|nr:type I-E CRISPR-associated protein Cse1/CasA [Pseudodesulfovibrio tunisiensis]
MKFNLLTEHWLPVRCEDNTMRRIAPWEMTSQGLAPLAPNSPRPDFNAALLEFLVGLTQTAFAPANRKEWKARLAEPPSPEQLQQAFAPHEPYFNLLGERPRFLQDLTMKEKDKPARVGVASLFIEQPSGNTLTTNKDVFIKRGQVETLCPACAAAALYTLQAFAPAGGKGHRTSMRGGGPLSTLIPGRTLWESVWLNVIPSDNVKLPSASGPDELEKGVYAWMSPTHTSEKGEEVTPEAMHPLHAYWGMPRRIVLEECEATGPCDICGMEHPVAVRTYLTRPNGCNYSSYWLHPLTPYRMSTPPLSIKGRADIEAYSNWLGLVYGEPEISGKAGENRVGRALCIKSLPRRLHGQVNVAGYDMDNAKAQEWCEHAFPVYVVEGNLTDFRTTVRDMVQAADQVRRNLVGALKDAMVHEAGKNQAKIDMTIFDNAGTAFWSETESMFYSLMEKLAALPDSDEALARTDELMLEWGSHLLHKSMVLFDKCAGGFGIPVERMERFVLARDKMVGFNVKKLRTFNMYPQKEAA